MQIHEITKRQRTDEGLLDKVKNTISAVKTKAVTAGDRWQEKQWDKAQDKRNKEAADAAKVLARKGFNVDTTTPAARAQTPTRVKQQQQQKIAQLQQAFDQEFDVKSGGGGPVATDDDAGGIKVTVNGGEYRKDNKGQWYTELNQPVTKPESIAMLNAKADNPGGEREVNPSAVQPVKPVQPAAKSYSPEDVLIPGSNYDTGKPPPPGFVQIDLARQGKTPQTRFVHKSQVNTWTKEGWKQGAGDGSVAYSNKPAQSNATPQPQVKEGALAQRAQARNAGVTQTPAQATQNPSGKKDISKEFKSWIGQHIPGLENVSPEVSAKLDAIYNQMKSAEDQASIDAAFQQYAELALASVGNASQGQQGQSGTSASAKYAQNNVAQQLGISPDAISTLQQRIAQNKEQISNTHTGSKTIDTLIQAVTKR
jgi:hypothetical protein